jgi:hypothetical protein
MILKKAIRDFLERERHDFRKYKKLSRAELNAKMAELPIRPPIWKKLYKHQRVCLLLGIMQRGFAFFLDTGMGKTLLAVALGRYFQKAEGDKKWLVLVPNKINKAEWSRELKKWGAGKERLILRGSSAAKWAKLRKSKAMFVVETYGGFIRLACEKKEVKRKRKLVVKLVPNKKKVTELKRLFQAVVADESTELQSKHALCWRVVCAMGKAGAKVFAMTGTPFGRDPTPLWGQLFLVDRGWTLGETLGLFRAALFSESRNPWGGFDYRFLQSEEKTLNRLIAHSSIRYEVDQSDLPKLIPLKRKVRLPADAMGYFEKAHAALVEAGKSGDFQEGALMFLRMRQIASGWLGYKDDDTGKRAEIEFSNNPKLEMLLSDIHSIPHKCIVFHEFVFTGSMICRALTQDGISWARISGETTEHERILADFDKPSGPQVLVLNNRFSMGPNLQAAKYGLVFEAPTRCILRKQGIRRFERQGSAHKKVFLIDYVALNTYDQRILDFLAEGKDLFEAVVNGKERGTLKRRAPKRKAA